MVDKFYIIRDGLTDTTIGIVDWPEESVVKFLDELLEDEGWPEPYFDGPFVINHLEEFKKRG